MLNSLLLLTGALAQITKKSYWTGVEIISMSGPNYSSSSIKPVLRVGKYYYDYQVKVKNHLPTSFNLCNLQLSLKYTSTSHNGDWSPSVDPCNDTGNYGVNKVPASYGSSLIIPANSEKTFVIHKAPWDKDWGHLGMILCFAYLIII